MLPKLMVIIFIIFVYSCAQQDQKDLTATDSLHIKMVTQENVAVLGGPPMIPVDHPVVIGEDVDKFSNGASTCLECHNDPDEEDAPQTMHPERNNCVQCHIPQAEETATEEDFMVENDFQKKTKF